MASSISSSTLIFGFLVLSRSNVVLCQSTPWINGGNIPPNVHPNIQPHGPEPTAVSQAIPVNNHESNVVDANPTEPRMEDGGKMFLGVLSSYLEYETFKNNKEDDNRPLSVFYEGLGWFYRNGSLSNIDRLPASPAEVDTKFLLYTVPNQLTAQFLNYENISSIQQSNFQPGLPTVVITHGFKTSTGTASLQWIMLYIDALFRRQGPGNYIVTDWSKGAQAPEYWAAAANAPLVGAQLARLIEMLCQVKGAQPQSFQLIGFSLGAHVSGFAGKRLKTTVGKVGRIVGLDPAGPLFEDAQPGGRLSKGDADFVMTVHGSADGVKNGGLGIWSQLGDVDFYANGGKTQPGCGHMISTAIENLLKLDFKAVPEAIQCNHNRNWMYVLQTFDPLCTWPAVPCDAYSNVRARSCHLLAPTDQNQALSFYLNNWPSSSRMFFETNGAAGPSGSACAYQVKVTIMSSKASTIGRGNFSVVFVDHNGVEATPYIIAHDGRLPAGKQAFLLVRSPVMPSTIRKIKILYHRYCEPDVCYADTLNMKSVAVATISNDVVKSSCSEWDLSSDTWHTLDLRDTTCKKPSAWSDLVDLFGDIYKGVGGVGGLTEILQADWK